MHVEPELHQYLDRVAIRVACWDNLLYRCLGSAPEELVVVVVGW